MTNVTYGYIYMTHDAGQRYRKSRETQSRTGFAAAFRRSARCGKQNGSRLLSLATASVPIPSASRAIETGCSSRGCEDRVYRQAFRKVGRTLAVIRQQKRVVSERHCESCPGGFSPAEEEAWVNGHQVGTTRFSWNIGLIVCYRQSWNRSLSYWCPTSGGSSSRQSRKRFRRN